MKKFFALVIALMMIICAGCSLVPEKEPAANNDVTVESIDAAIATVGEESVSFREYSDLFNTYAQYYMAMGIDLSSDTEALKEFQDMIVDSLVENMIIAYQAKQAGMDQLSPEKLEEAKKLASDEYESIMDGYKSQAEGEAVNDASVDVEKRIEELLAEESELYTGKVMNREEFAQYINDSYIQAAISENFRVEMLKDVTVSDEDIQAWYDDALAEAKQLYTENPGSYKDDKEAEMFYAAGPVLYAPDGYKRMMHILVAPTELIPEEYSEKDANISALKEEYGALAAEVNLEGGDGAKRMKEIEAEFKTVKAEMDKIMEGYMAESVKRANEAHDKLTAGEDIYTIAKEYSVESMSVETGRLLSNKYVTADFDWSNEIKSAVAPLKPGEFTNVIHDDEGCHIFYYLSDEPAGEVDINSVKEIATEMLLEQKQADEWYELMEIWKNDGSVTLNPDLIYSIGVQ